MLQGHLARFFFFFNIFIKLNHQKAAKLHRHKKNVQYFWSRLWSWLGSDSYSKVVTGDRWVSDWPGLGIEQPVKPIAMTLIKKYFHPAWSLERESSSGGCSWRLLMATLIIPSLSLPLPLCHPLFVGGNWEGAGVEGQICFPHWVLDQRVPEREDALRHNQGNRLNHYSLRIKRQLFQRQINILQLWRSRDSLLISVFE